MPELILNVLKDALDKYDVETDEVTLVRQWLDSIAPDEDFELETDEEDVQELKRRIAANSTETKFYTATEARAELANSARQRPLTPQELLN
jgi:hypothetical protein